VEQARGEGRELIDSRESLLHQGILKPLATKDSDIRIQTLHQSRDVVDQGLHAGGA
jgi:transketolase